MFLVLGVACGRSMPIHRATTSATGGRGSVVLDAGGGGSGGRDGAAPAADASAGDDAPPETRGDLAPDGARAVAPERSIDQALDDTAVPAPDLGSERAHADSLPGEPPHAPVATLELVAGQLGGQGAHDGIGTAARFSDPSGVTTDGMGNLFVADTANNTIRKLVIGTLEVTTFAGAAGHEGSDDGIGSAARFHEPRGIVSDGAGNLYVADAGNRTIRQVVVATGVVTTVAGAAGSRDSLDGKGADARFSYPVALAHDGAGDLFVIDLSSHGTFIIRKVRIATGEVTTVAGGGDTAEYADGVGSEAHFLSPQALACDQAGSVYVADGARVRRLEVASRTVTTLATNVAFQSLTGIAYDAALGLLLADADAEDSKIRQVDTATALVTTLVTQADAAANCSWRNVNHSMGSGPRLVPTLSLTGDGRGNLYVADNYNGTVCAIASASRTVTKLAGLGAASELVDGVGTQARFLALAGLATDGAGHIFAADSCAIREIGIASAEVTTLSGDRCGRHSGLSTPQLASDGHGNLFFFDARMIFQMDVATAEVTALAGSDELGRRDGTGSDAGFERPTSLVYDGAGHLFVAEQDAQYLRKVDVASGAVVTIPVLGAPSGDPVAPLVGHAAGLACDETGNVFIADSDRCAIYKMEPATGTTMVVAGSPGECGFADGRATAARFLGPSDMASDGAGSLYVADPLNHVVRKLEVATGAVTTVVGSAEPFDVVGLGPLPAHLNWPSGLAFVPGLGLFIGDANENAILLARF